MTHEIKTYKRFNGGFWEDDERRLTGSKPKLSAAEQQVANAIRQRLTTQKTVIVVDIGAGLAASLSVIAAHFSEEISSGGLKLLATQKEKRSQSRALTVAQNRLQTGKPKTRQWRIEGNIRCLKRTLNFVRKQTTRVDFLGGVDTQKLPNLLQRLGIGKADVVVEHFGGLFHHNKPRAAVRSVNRSLKPDGILFTGETINDDHAKYGDTSKLFAPERNYQWGEPGIRTYRKSRRK